MNTYHIFWTGPDGSGKLWPVEYLLICFCTRVDKNHHQVYWPDCFVCQATGVKWETINSSEPKSTLSINLVIAKEHRGGGDGSLSNGGCELTEIHSSQRWNAKAFTRQWSIYGHFTSSYMFFFAKYDINYVVNILHHVSSGACTFFTKIHW